jgi:bifunctional DNA-binding transcriptional regulator/antitoxin component of YhaV-PrlF toxin-antitoxin module
MAEKQNFRQERNAMSEATIQLRDKGVITLPMNLRRKYSLRTGDVFAVSDLGEGVFMITPKTSRVAALGDEVAGILQAEGVTVEEILEGLDEERERYYREHYVND